MDFFLTKRIVFSVVAVTETLTTMGDDNDETQARNIAMMEEFLQSLDSIENDDNRRDISMTDELISACGKRRKLNPEEAADKAEVDIEKTKVEIFQKVLENELLTKHVSERFGITENYPNIYVHSPMLSPQFYSELEKMGPVRIYQSSYWRMTDSCQLPFLLDG